ncbi:MAG: hypothetical protein ACMUIA_04020 [bacterium]
MKKSKGSPCDRFFDHRFIGREWRSGYFGRCELIPGITCRDKEGILLGSMVGEKSGNRVL